MTRGWIGFVLLLILLGGTWLSAWAMEQWNRPLEQTMEQAASCALEENWQQAENFRLQVQAQWQRQWHCCAAFADHEPMEAIDGLLSQLAVYGEAKDAVPYAALCREIAREMGALGEGNIPHWWNLL